MTTLQEQFEEDFSKRAKNIDANKKYENSTFTNWDLDLREYKKLRVFRLNNNNLTSINLTGLSNLTQLILNENKLTSMDVSNNPKLTDLFISSELFCPENKIIGLEKTSIVRLDCRGGDLLQKSRDPRFIWDVFIRKYNTTFPEMKLLDISDLNELAGQVNEETTNNEEFLAKICPRETKEFIDENKGNYYWILDQLANTILARCLIIQNRLYTDEKDPEYEKHLTELAQRYLVCYAMNPKHPEASLYSGRLERVNQAINGDKELLQRLQDLPYLNPKYELENVLKTKELETQIQKEKEIKKQVQERARELEVGIIKLNQQNEQLINQNKELNQQLTQKDNRLFQLEKLFKGTANIFNKQHNYIDQLKTKLEQESQDKNLSQEQTQHLEQDIKRIEAEKQELNQRIKELQEQENKIKTERDHELNQAREKISKLTNSDKEQEALITQLQTKITELEKEVAHWKDKFNQSIEFLKEIKEDVKNL